MQTQITAYASNELDTIMLSICFPYDVNLFFSRSDSENEKLKNVECAENIGDVTTDVLQPSKFKFIALQKYPTTHYNTIRRKRKLIHCQNHLKS